ncbi:hypothetical protein QZH41_020003, partial [Actinostola sp. cb2023]
MAALSKHAQSFLISEEENDLTKEILGNKRHKDLCAVTVPYGDRAVSKHSDWLSNDFAHCDWLNRMSPTECVKSTVYFQSLCSAIVQLFLAPPPNRGTWVIHGTGVGCLVKDGTTRSYYIRIVDLTDCRAALNFCDEHEAQLFRAAIKERIRDFKRKRDENRARKMMSQQQRYNAAMMGHAAYVQHPAAMQMIRVQTLSGQTALVQVPSQVGYVGGARQMGGRGRGRMMSPQMRPQMSTMQGMRPQMSTMQGMRPQMSTMQGMRPQMSTMRPGMRPRPQQPGPPMGRGPIQGGARPQAPPQAPLPAVPQAPKEEPRQAGKKKKKGGFFSFLKRKKTDVPASPVAHAPAPVSQSGPVTSPH